MEKVVLYQLTPELWQVEMFERKKNEKKEGKKCCNITIPKHQILIDVFTKTKLLKLKTF